MTKLDIIYKLWGSVYNLLALIKGTPTKSLEDIERELDVIEYECRRFIDTDDEECYCCRGCAKAYRSLNSDIKTQFTVRKPRFKSKNRHKM